MNRIELKFRQLRALKKKALIPFVTAGYPDLATTEKLVLAMEEAGADLIELGVPFSDPVADGPVIQMSSFEALKKGVNLKKILLLVRRLRSKTQVPLALMTYFNPVLQYGLKKFVADVCSAGVDGLIIPDLPWRQEEAFMMDCRRSGLDVVLFISPTTPKKTARFIISKARGFIYFVSLSGVTGQRQKLPSDLKARLKEIKDISGNVPVCVGFGVSNAGQVREICHNCDGVIVGSAIIRKIAEAIAEAKAKDIVKRVSGFVRQLVFSQRGANV